MAISTSTAPTGASATLPSPVEFERAGLKGWPGIEVKWDRNWVRRASNGLTQRANSAQCFDPSDDDDVEARIARVKEWYAARGQAPIFRVNLLTGPRLAEALDAQGWITVDHSLLMAMELGDVQADGRGRIFAADDPRFLEAQQRLKNWDDVTVAKFKAILAVLKVPACGIVLYAEDGSPASSALMAVADGIVITSNVETSLAHRRKGYGASMMRAGLAWAKAEGAEFAALNVGAENVAGQALYRSLGYRPQYEYFYRLPGPA